MFLAVRTDQPITTFTEDVENTRQAQLAWVRATMDALKWRQNRLAQESGVDQSTLSKFLNDKNNLAQLNTKSVEKIRKVSPIPPYETKIPATPRGVGYIEASHIVPYSEPVTAAVLGSLPPQNQILQYTLQSRALEAAGYMPGDVMVIDPFATPVSGDIVLAEISASGTTEEVFRIYEKPYLVAASLARLHLVPHLVDDDRVRISGVVVGSWRPRRSSIDD